MTDSLEAGDVIWLNFNPQSGHEQAGHRPAVIISPSLYNRRSRLVICCPVTTKIKDHPFEVRLSGEPASVALVDHVKSLDWRNRNPAKKGRVTAAELLEIRKKLSALIGM
jgi:mRNA interferase MazF